jgi:RNA polymerase sigma factor (sigma-70 family)
MNPLELYQANADLIDRVIGRVCLKNRLYGADADDFASEARVAVLADDCAILREWEGRASLATYLSVVVQRLFSDARMQALGRFRPSTEARRMGAAAVQLETVVVRDGRSIEEALPLVRAIDPSLDRADLAAMLDRLPERTRRPRAVDLECAVDVPSASDSADASVKAAEEGRLAERTGRTVRAALDSLPLEDQIIVRLRYTGGMSVADIARMLQLEQRPLYRRLEAIHRTLRNALRDEGIDGAHLEDLIGSPTQEMNFGLAGEAGKTADSGQSTNWEGPVGSHRR